MQGNIMRAAEKISLFCRLQMYIRKELPVKSSEMGVLIYVQKEKEDVTPLMISQFFQVAKPSVTAMINALVKKNYLIKKPSATDGRSYTVEMTDTGLELVASTHSEYFKAMSTLEEKMGTEDFNLFIELIGKANTILSGVKEQL